MKYIYPLIVAVAALTLSGCAQKEVRIILLPEDGGKVGRIELTDKSGKSYTVDKAWEQVELSTDGKAKSEITSEQAVMAQFGQTLSALPIPPATFMIFFKSDSAEILGASLKELEGMLGQIKERKPNQIICAGHSDSLGEKSYNKSLSLKRAEAVQKYLIKHGIDKNIIEISYYGDANPLVKTAPGASNAKNRRVEIIAR